MNKRLASEEAADYIGMSLSWITKSRMNGSGPTYMKIGGAVRYLPSDLDAWLNGTRRTGVYAHCNDNARARPVA